MTAASAAGAPLRAGARTPESKLYLLVRRDLPRAVRAVQAAHAAVSLSLVAGERLLGANGPCGPPIVLLGAGSEAELRAWRDRLGDETVAFHEPDLNGALTALAYYGPPVDGLGGLRLL